MRRRRRSEVDSGPSPFPWIHDEVWRLWNRFNPDGAQLRDEPPITEPRLTLVTAGDRERAVRLPPASDASPPPLGTLAEHERLLASTTGSGYMGHAAWPVCCARLGTLVMDQGGGVPLERLEQEAGSLDDALLDAERADHPLGAEAGVSDWVSILAQMRAGHHSGDAIVIFQCRACDRVYGGYCEP